MKRFLIAYFSNVRKWQVILFVVCLFAAGVPGLSGLAKFVGLDILPLVPIIKMYLNYRKNR